MVDEEGSPAAVPPEADPAAPVKAARAKKVAPSKKAVGGTKKSTTAKKAAPAKKAGTAKKAVPAKKAAAKKAAAKKAVPTKRVAATKKAASPRARSTKPPVMPAAVMETPDPEIVSVSEPEQEPSPWAAADFVDEADTMGSESPPTEPPEPPPPAPPPPPSAWGPPTSVAPPPPPPPPPPAGHQWQQGAFPPPPPPAEKKNRWLLPLLLGLAALAIVAGIVALVLIVRDDGDSSVKSTTPATFPSTSERPTSEPTTEAPTNGSGQLDALFDPIAGFTLVPAPEVGAAFRQQLQEVPGLKNVFDDSAARRVVADGQDVAVVIAVEFNSRIASNPGLASGFNAGATVGSDSTEKVTIDGQDLTRFQRPDGTTGYVFVNGGIGVVVAGDADASTMEALVKGLIANANGAD